jgi:hypothetical protein
LNVDESFWLILYLLRKTVAPTGAETVKVEVDGDPNAGLTLMGQSPSLAGNFRYSWWQKDSLAVVTNNSVTSPIRLMFIAHSQSGWVTQPVCSEYLAYIRQQIPDGLMCFVVDQYPTHATP